MKKITLTLLALLLTTHLAVAQILNVATYNIRNDNAGDVKNGNGWNQRAPIIAQLVQFHDFDLFGTQEAKNNQINDLLQNLPDYTSVGVGRDDGKTRGEYVAIFFKKSRFSLIKSDTFCLSTDTTKPNRGWDAALPRICTWAELKDLENQKHLFVFNIHFDHIGVTARRESSKLHLEKVAEIAKDQPAILMGDFNIDQKNESYKILQNSDLLEDSYELAPLKYATNGTFNNFDANNQTDSRIDHIFLTKQWSVKRYGVLTDTYRSLEGADGKTYTSGNFPKEVSLKNTTARTPSDHFPVNAIISW